MNLQEAVGGFLNLTKINQLVTEFFALDIGTTAIRAVELVQRGQGQWELSKYAVTPIEPQLSGSEAPEDQKKLADAVMTTLQTANITSKNVAVGLPSSKVFSTVIEVPNVMPQELPMTVHYQAENFIPTPIDETKLDWALLGPSLRNTEKLEVLVASVANEYTEKQLAFLENLGLNVISFEPDTVALARALLPANLTSNHLIIDCGDAATDILVMTGDSPRLMRSVPLGLQHLVKALASNMGVTEPEAEQYLMKFGLAPGAMEGRITAALQHVLEELGTELDKTVEYVQKTYPGLEIASTLVSGYVGVVPGFADLIATHTGGQVNFATPWQNVIVPEVLQAQIAPLSTQLGVAVGLAEKEAH